MGEVDPEEINSNSSFTKGLAVATMGIANHFISFLIYLFYQEMIGCHDFLLKEFYVSIIAYQRLFGVLNSSSSLKHTSGAYCLLLSSSCDEFGLRVWLSLSVNTELRGGEVKPSYGYHHWPRITSYHCMESKFTTDSPFWFLTQPGLQQSQQYST